MVDNVMGILSYSMSINITNRVIHVCLIRLVTSEIDTLDQMCAVRHAHTL